MKKTTAMDGSALNSNSIAIPCGYFAGMFPVGSINLTTASGSTIAVNMTELTNFNYNNPNVNASLQWVDLSDPVFQSWM